MRAASRTRDRPRGAEGVLPHCAAKRFGRACRVVRGPRHEGSGPPEAAVGDEQVQVRMPVRTGAMGLQARDDTAGEVSLTDQRPIGILHHVREHSIRCGATLDRPSPHPDCDSSPET